MTEFELKFEVPADRLARLEAAVRDGAAVRQRLKARYFDTEDGILARHGLVVRMRKEGPRQWVQTVKGPAGGPLARLEHDVAVQPVVPGQSPAVDLARHSGTAVGKHIRKALKLKAGEPFPPLGARYETDVQRLKRSVQRGGTTVEIALDRGRVFSGSLSRPLCELELELKQGRPEDAVLVAREWCAEHGLWLSSVSKSTKGRRMASPSPFGAAVPARPPQYGRHASGRQVAAAVWDACLEQILGNASELAAGSKEADHVHQLRVGIRRLRTAMRELKGLAGDTDADLEPPLVAAFRALGRHRDQSHLARSLQPQIEAAGGPTFSTGSASDATSPRIVVLSPPVQDALLELVGFAHRDDPDPGPDAAETKEILRARLARLHAQVAKAGKNFLALDEDRQHGVRKRLKRLRYLAEFAAPLFPARRTESYLARLKPVQDALGLYNDELTALRGYTKLAEQDPRALFGVGWLSARRMPHAKACRHALEDFAGTKPFWT